MPNPEWLMRALSASVEMFLHHTFGERYTATLLSGLLVVWIMSFLSTLVPRPGEVQLMPLVCLVYLVGLGLHFASVWRRRQAGVHIDSRSCGTPWTIWSSLNLPERLTKTLIEPLLCIAGCLLTVMLDLAFSLWLGCAGVALIIKSILLEYQARNQALDTFDTQAAARNLRADLNRHAHPGAQAEPTPVVPAAPRQPRGQERPRPDFIRNLDPALQRLIQESATAPAPHTTAPEPLQRAAQPEPTDSVPARIHVRPQKPSARTSESTGQPSTTPGVAKPRVTIMRTRPAPLRVSPAKGPEHHKSQAHHHAGSPTQEPNKRAAPTPECTPSQKQNDNLPTVSTTAPQSSLPSNSEIQPTQSNASQSADGSEIQTGHHSLKQRISLEAERLGFVVLVPGGSAGANHLASDLLLTMGETTLWVLMLPERAVIEHRLQTAKALLTSSPNRLALVSEDADLLKAMAEAVHANLPIDQAMKVGYFKPQEFGSELLRLANAAVVTRKRKKRS